MKINGSDEIIKNSLTEKPLRRGQDQKDGFKNVLKASVERSARHPEKIKSSSLANPVSAIQFHPLSPENKRVTLERVDNFLNLLDNYRDQLADPKVTLRDIEPVINRIAKEKEQLSSVMESLPNEDELKDIVNRTLITASIEVLKYNRGDYIAS
jgi:hypothetical protein